MNSQGENQESNNEKTQSNAPAGDAKLTGLEDGAQGHWALLRDVVGFQFKLALDAFRDLLLSPISIIAALVGAFTDPERPGKYFNELLRLGHRSDRWINLFGGAQTPDESSSDAYLRRMENLLVSEYQKGGVVKTVKDVADTALTKLHKLRDQDKDKDHKKE